MSLKVWIKKKTEICSALIFISFVKMLRFIFVMWDMNGRFGLLRQLDTCVTPATCNEEGDGGERRS